MGALELLRGITTNLRSSSQRKRKLYATAITSIVTYAAPIWASEIRKNHYTKKFLNKFDKAIAQRVCYAYRTVSGVAALMVAGLIPTIYLASKLEAAHHEYKERSKEEDVSHMERVRIGQNALREAILSWFNYMRDVQDTSPGVRTKEAIVLSIEE